MGPRLRANSDAARALINLLRHCSELWRYPIRLTLSINCYSDSDLMPRGPVSVTSEINTKSAFVSKGTNKTHGVA